MSNEVTKQTPQEERKLRRETHAREIVRRYATHAAECRPCLTQSPRCDRGQKLALDASAACIDAELDVAVEVARALPETEAEHCYSGGAFNFETRTGGCHAGEPADVAFCDCECAGCRS